MFLNRGAFHIRSFCSISVDMIGVAPTLTDNLLSRLHIHEPKRNHCDAVYMYVVCTSCIYPCTHQVLHQWKVAIGIVTFIEFRHIVEAIRNNPVLYTKSVHFIMLQNIVTRSPTLASIEKVGLD